MKKAVFETTLITTYACTLNCRLCTSDVPYHFVLSGRGNTLYYSLTELAAEMERYFRIVDHIDRFTLSGGEPLLCKELPEIIDISMKYSAQFDELRIITNGTLPITESLDPILKKWRKKVFFLIDNYGKYLSINLDAVSGKLDQLGVPYDIRKYYGQDIYANGWIDFGTGEFLQESNEQIKQKFKICNSHINGRQCYSLVNGMICQCSYLAKLINREVLSRKAMGCVDLFDDTVSNEFKRGQLADLQLLEFNAACAYCKGFSEESQRFPAAEQI